MRIKVPEARAPRDENGNVKFGATGWHQDNGVVNEEADETDMLTVWFPLMDASAENGCLQVVPGSHRGELLTHCPGWRNTMGTTVPTHMFDSGAAMPVPVKKGNALFLHPRTVHSALPNVSDRIRWSFDLRYQPIGQPTGRAAFPEFVARSRANPESELRDAAQWHKMWEDTRDRLARSEQPKFNRWDSDDPACA